MLGELRGDTTRLGWECLGSVLEVPIALGKTRSCKGLLSKERGYNRAEPLHSPAGRGGSFPSQFPWLSHDGSRGEGTFSAGGSRTERGFCS